jgi:hypothetical protein
MKLTISCCELELNGTGQCAISNLIQELIAFLFLTPVKIVVIMHESTDAVQRASLQNQRGRVLFQVKLDLKPVVAVRIEVKLVTE